MTRQPNTSLRYGKINVYTCQTCRRDIVTIDIDDGVTPFMVTCPECGNEAFSHCYEVNQQLRPQWEWFRPTEDQLVELTREELAAIQANNAAPVTITEDDAVLCNREHLEKGGLFLRSVMPRPSAPSAPGPGPEAGRTA